MIKKLIVFFATSMGTLFGSIQVGEGTFTNQNAELHFKKVKMQEDETPGSVQYAVYKEVDTGLMYAFFTLEREVPVEEFIEELLGRRIRNSDDVSEKEDGLLVSCNINLNSKDKKDYGYDVQSIRIWAKNGKTGLILIKIPQDLKEHTDEVLNTFTFS